MLVLQCEACGRRTVTMRNGDKSRCVHCASSEVKVFSPLRLSISWGTGDYKELGNESRRPRDDLIRMDAAQLL